MDIHLKQVHFNSIHPFVCLFVCVLKEEVMFWAFRRLLSQCLGDTKGGCRLYGPIIGDE